MIILEKSILLDTDSNKVWSLFTQLNEKFSELHKSHITFKCIAGNPNQVGSIYKLKRYFRGKIISIKYKLTEFTPNSKIVLFSEFPHVLLGLKITYMLRESNSQTIVIEKMEYGFNKPFFARIFNPIIKIILIPYLQYLKTDQEERLSGIRNVFKVESEKNN